MKKNFTLFVLTLLHVCAFGQKPTQTIHGIITDQQTLQTLPGATVTISSPNYKNSVISDSAGKFTLTKIPVGRVAIQVQYIGYEPYSMPDFLVTSTKEPYLTISLSPGAIATDEVVISASKNAFEPLNELSVVSTRSFTAEETERMPAGINDPARAALSYPGVQRGQDDTENQIVVRGNSPIGILWRLEGVDIPNPNHFAIIGSSGGGVSVFSAQLIAKSDFSTGGFSAEYGNALSGAFDIRFRNGNFEHRENRFKLSVLGMDFSTEGPIKKGRSSYLVNYRYSTLGLLSSMGIYLVGERVTNNFQDLSFNLTFRSKSGKSVQTVFGLGGLSEERYLPVSDPNKRIIGSANQWEDRVKPANMGAMGYTWTYLPDTRSYIKAVVAVMGSEIQRMSDTLDLQDQRFRFETQKYTDKRLVSSVTYQRKLTDKTVLKTGLIFNQIFFDFYKNTIPRTSVNDINQIQRKTSIQGSGQTQQLQQYVSLHHDISPKLSVNAGYHFLMLMANKSTSLEPRVSLQLKPTANQRLSLAYGLHGRILPLMAYYFKDSLGNYPNLNLKMLKAHHGVLAYHLYTKSKMRFSAETYVQQLINVPIKPDATATYWMLNNSSDFPEFATVSKGKGLNYGLDLSLEKLFSNSYYFLVTGSLLKSTYSTLTGLSYNSRFNTGFSTSYTGGKEFPLKNGGILQLGMRYLLNGGFRYTPFDQTLSGIQGSFVPLKNGDFSQQVPAYKRLDGRIAYRYNRKKLAGNISIDVQNILNRINASSISYNAATNTTKIEYRGSGFVPVLSFQFDF
jgi:hypothetical protein